MVQTMIETSHFGPKTDQNFIFPVLMQGVAVSWASTLNGASTLALACLLVWSSRSTWLGLGPRGRIKFSILANHLSFLHQLSDEPADGGITNIITHILCTFDIVIIHAFLLVIEMPICG